MIISAKPLRPVKAVLSATMPDIYGFSNGRQALHFAITTLVKNRHPSLLVPALFCQSALDDCTGADIHFYDVNDDGSLDVEVLCRRIGDGNFDVLIVNHLFGQTPAGRSTIYAACKDAKTLMIDDMCHCPIAWLANNRSQNYNDYDACLFSFRKFLAVAGGGGVAIHHRFKGESKIGTVRISLASRVKLLMERMVFAINQYWLLRLLMRLRPDAPNMVLPDNMKISGGELAPAKRAAHLSNAIASMIADEQLIDEIGSRRRNNYAALAAVVTPLNTRFSDGDAPQVFALRDTRDSVGKMMRQMGVSCFNWPGAELPSVVRQRRSEFPHAVDLADEILCLPVHQDLSDTQLDHIVKSLTIASKTLLNQMGGQ